MKELHRFFMLGFILLGLGLSPLYSSAAVNGSSTPQEWTNPPFAYSWGSSGMGPGQFNNPIGIAVAPSGHVIVADAKNNRIQVFDNNGNYLTSWDSANPADVALDSQGNIYVAEYYTRRLKKFDSTGWLLKTIYAGDNPRGLTVDTQDNIYLASEWSVKKYNTRLEEVQVFDAEAGYETDVAVDSSGNLYIVCFTDNTVMKYAPDGKLIARWGAINGGSEDGNFNGPLAIAVDHADRVYVADTGNRRIQVFSSGGQFLGKLGEPGTGPGQLTYTWGIAVDTWNNVFVTDYTLNRVEKFGSSAPTYAITGSILDQQGHPVGGAVVSLSGTSLTATTDPGGNYRIEPVTRGDYTLTAQKTDLPLWPPKINVSVTSNLTNKNFYEWVCGIPNMPVYYQGAPSTPNTLPSHPDWYHQTYGNYPESDTINTIGRWGCNLSSAAMITSFYGQTAQPPFSTDPGTLNSWLRDPVNKGYNPGNGVIYSQVLRYAVQNGVPLTLPEIGKRNDTKLDQALCSGAPTMLMVNSGGHYVVATGRVNVNGQWTYTLNDPKFGYTTLKESYNNQYGQAYYYRLGTDDTNRAMLEISAHSPVHLLITDPQGRRVGYDPRSGTTWDEIPESDYVIDAILSTTGALPEEKFVVIPLPLDGIYQVEIIGYETGDYTINTHLTDPTGLITTTSYSGQAEPNSSRVILLPVNMKSIYLPMLLH